MVVEMEGSEQILDIYFLEMELTELSNYLSLFRLLEQNIRDWVAYKQCTSIPHSFADTEGQHGQVSSLSGLQTSYCILT